MIKITLFILLFFVSVISSNDGIARPSWTSEDSKTCRSSFRKSYIQSSGGLKPSNSMVNEYCQCAEKAYKSGDAISKVTAECGQKIKDKYD